MKSKEMGYDIIKKSEEMPAKISPYSVDRGIR
jgi:hypothetical protein